jgi:Protein of unknown function (DUF3313)
MSNFHRGRGHPCSASRPARTGLVLSLTMCVAGCASASLDAGGSLSSYADLKSSDGMLAKSKLFVSKETVSAAHTVKIMPTTFPARAEADPITDEQRRLIGNAIDRSLCGSLSEKFALVSSGDADLTVFTRVTQLTATDETAVAVSKGGAIAKAVLLPGVPVPTPRLPIGLGSLSVEAEAKGPDNRQAAAMIWGRGANVLSGSARVSTSGDAYELASAFGEDFSSMLITGDSPFGKMPRAPSVDRVKAMAGGAPKYAACETFGREPGVVGAIGGAIGVPPEWNDKGGKPAAAAPEPAQASAQ